MFEVFGVGYAYASPTGGNQPTNKTPALLMGLQEVSFNRTAKMVPLKGSNQYPDAVAIADKEIKGKAKVARVDGDLWNNILFGENPATNAPIWYPNEAHTIPASTPFTVVVTNHSTFLSDQGVRYTNGQPFTNMQGATLTAVGQYNVSAGTYTFYSGDAGTQVLISYEGSSTTGTLFTEHNQQMGWSPIVQLCLWNPYSTTLNLNTNNGFLFYNVVFGGTNVPEKRDDWTYPELEWEAYPSTSVLSASGLPAVWSILDGGGTGQ
jgi:hypothetical protein